MFNLNLGANAYVMILGMIIVSIWGILYGSLLVKFFVVGFWILVNAIQLYQNNKLSLEKDENKPRMEVYKT